MTNPEPWANLDHLIASDTREAVTRLNNSAATMLAVVEQYFHEAFPVLRSAHAQLDRNVADDDHHRLLVELVGLSRVHARIRVAQQALEHLEDGQRGPLAINWLGIGEDLPSMVTAQRMADAVDGVIATEMDA